MGARESKKSVRERWTAAREDSKRGGERKKATGILKKGGREE